MKMILYCGLALCLLSGCASSNHLKEDSVARPEVWHISDASSVKRASADSLKQWWVRLSDPTLTRLVEEALQNSPDRLVAEARVLEARGLRRSTKASLAPQINGSASAGRKDIGSVNADDFYDVGFDASYELDIFGKNRRRDAAALADLYSLEAQYHDFTLTLLADIARAYVDYCAYQKQVNLAYKNLSIQNQTLSLIQERKALGESPQLDVERAENLVNGTQAAIAKYERLAEVSRLQLSVLVGLMPEQIQRILSEQKLADTFVLEQQIEPVLMSPATVLVIRPDIRAAEFYLKSRAAQVDATSADIFPTFDLGGFFGLSGGILFNSEKIWSAAINAAVSLIDFGRIAGRIDAAKAREKQAYEQYRKVVLKAVSEVETALSDYAHIRRERLSLKNALVNAEKALQLSQTLFNEGEVSFLDVLDAERTVNNADAALVVSEAEELKSVIRLFKSLGVY